MKREDETLFEKRRKEEGKRAVENLLKRIENSRLLTESEKELLKKYKDKKELKRHQPKTIVNHLSVLFNLRTKFGIINKPLDEITINDESYSEWFKAIDNNPRWKTIRSRAKLKEVLIAFHKWRFEANTKPKVVEDVEIYRGANKEMSIIVYFHKRITFKQFLKIVRAETNVRNQAILTLLWHGGLRVSELYSLKIRDITLKNVKPEIYLVRVPATKTKSRELPLWIGKKIMIKWLDTHPKKDDEEAYLFGSMYDGVWKPLTTQAIANVTKTAVKRAGLEKKVFSNPHWFRKSCACYLANTLERNVIDLKYWLGDDSLKALQHYFNTGFEEQKKKALRSTGYSEEELEEVLDDSDISVKKTELKKQADKLEEFKKEVKNQVEKLEEMFSEIYKKSSHS